MQCPSCGSEIRAVKLPDGRQVTIVARSELGAGPDRYIVDSEDAGKATPVSPRFVGSAHSDHSVVCGA